IRMVSKRKMPPASAGGRRKKPNYLAFRIDPSFRTTALICTLPAAWPCRLIPFSEMPFIVRPGGRAIAAEAVSIMAAARMAAEERRSILVSYGLRTGLTQLGRSEGETRMNEML